MIPQGGSVTKAQLPRDWRLIAAVCRAGADFVIRLCDPATDARRMSVSCATGLEACRLVGGGAGHEIVRLVMVLPALVGGSGVVPFLVAWVIIW